LRFGAARLFLVLAFFAIAPSLLIGVWTLNSWERMPYPLRPCESRLAAECPHQRREAADERRKGDEDGGIENKHDTRLRMNAPVHVPYLFPTCNRKIPTCGVCTGRQASRRWFSNFGSQHRYRWPVLGERYVRADAGAALPEVS
jgi:hypothetical protein